MASSVENLLHTLENDRKLLVRFRQILNLEDDYAKKSDLLGIIEEMKAQREEMKAQREEFSSKFDRSIEGIKAMRTRDHYIE